MQNKEALVAMTKEPECNPHLSYYCFYVYSDGTDKVESEGILLPE